jgi:tetratricopeptide (TPR) repeat protein
MLGNLDFDRQRFRRLLAVIPIIGLLLAVGLKTMPLLNRNLGIVFLNKATLDTSLTVDQRRSNIERARTLVQRDQTEGSFISERVRSFVLSSAEFGIQEYIEIGDLWLDLGEFQRAEEWYSLAIEQDQTSSAAWYHLGLTREVQGKIVDAVSAFQKSIDLDNFPVHPSGSSVPYCHLGWLLRQTEAIRDLAQAQKLLETGVRVADFGSPETESECYLELGNVLRWRNYPPQEYFELYHRAVTADSQNASAFVMLGVAHYQLHGDIVKAREYIQASIAIEPSVKAYEELAKLYSEEKDYEEAIATYEKALDIAITNRSVPAIQAEIKRLRSIQSEE